MNNNDSFFVTLISDQAEDYQNHTKSDFKTKLAKSINLKKKNWEVALVELFVPPQTITINDTNDKFYLVVRNPKVEVYDSVNNNKVIWLDNVGLLQIPSFFYQHLMRVQMNTPGVNVSLKRNIFEDRYSNNILVFEAKIPQGGYINIQYLLEVINSIIEKVFAQGLMTLEYDSYSNNHTNTGVKIELIYDEDTKRIKLKSNEDNNLGLAFHKDVFERMGGLPYDLCSIDDIHGHRTSGKYQGFFRYDSAFFKYGVDLYTDSNDLFIYSDLVEHTLVGDMLSPLLRIIGYEPSKINGNIYHIEFQNFHYIPISKSSFDEISILIRGDNGLPVQFIKGVTMVKLHFRQKQIF